MDCTSIREMLEDLAHLAMSSTLDFVSRVLPLVDAEIKEIGELLHPIRQAFRRTCSSLENTELPADAVPVIRPSLEAKYRAALIAHYAAMVLDFFVGLGVSRMAFKLAWGWSLGVGGIYVVLALLSRVLASIFLNRNRPGRYVPICLVLGASGWLVILGCFLVLYFIRNGLLDVSALGIVTPLLWVGFFSQSAAFGGLAEVYGYPIELFRRYRTLVMRRAELMAVRELLVSQESFEGVPKRPVSGDDARESRKSRRATLKPVPARRGPARVGRALGLMALLSLSLIPSHRAHANPIGDQAISRVVLAPDESPGTEDTDEFLRVRRALCAGLEVVTSSLPNVQSIEVLHWSDATSVWAAGRLFSLPRQSHFLPVEASLAPFAPALSRRQESDEALDRTAHRPVLERVRQELMTRPNHPATQTCVTQLVCRAVEAPTSELWLVASDLRDFRCDSIPSCVPGGARICVVAIPQNEGADTRRRLTERIDRIQKLFPRVVVVPSWEVDDPASLRALLDRVISRPSREEDNQ